MRRFRITIETPHGTITDTFEVEDDSTDDDIAEDAQVLFTNKCSYGFEEITDEDDA